MRTERITFTGAQGDRLSARVDRPIDGRVQAWLLFAHCFTCSKDLRAVGNLTHALNQAGIGVFRFDFTGLGQSEGEFADTSLSSNVDDLRAAAAWMEEQLEAPAILVGHSFGGAAVIRAAGHLPSVRAVATIGAPFDPAHVTHLFEEALDEIEAEGSADVEIAGRRFTLSSDFVQDLDGRSMESAIRELRRPLLIFHSPIDQIVGVENARAIYEAARHPKSFVSLDDADHLLLDEGDSRYVGSVLAAWAARYLPPRPERGRSEAELADDAVVTRTPGDTFRTEVLARGHALLADEPVAVGGDDLGPTPYDLLAAALGACTSMTLGMYARRKGWPLDEAAIRVRHTRIHARDSERCDDREPRMDRLAREITLEGDLDEEQRARLLEIADRCPVHRTLSAGVEITTRAAEDGG